MAFIRILLCRSTDEKAHRSSQAMDQQSYSHGRFRHPVLHDGLLCRSRHTPFIGNHQVVLLRQCQHHRHLRLLLQIPAILLPRPKAWQGDAVCRQANPGHLHDTLFPPPIPSGHDGSVVHQ